jgi:hypothetical protein
MIRHTPEAEYLKAELVDGGFHYVEKTLKITRVKGHPLLRCRT